MIRNRTTVKPGLFLQPFVVSQLSGTLIEQIVEGSEVTASEYAVTSWLNVVGSATPGELSRELGMSPTTLSAMIERLVRKKQVRRVRHPEDGRSYVLEPTAQGQGDERAERQAVPEDDRAAAREPRRRPGGDPRGDAPARSRPPQDPRPLKREAAPGRGPLLPLGVGRWVRELSAAPPGRFSPDSDAQNPYRSSCQKSASLW